MGYYRRDRRDRRTEQEDTKFKSEVLYINRVAKVLKGGRRFRFTALVAAGDGEGKVGLGLGKAPEVVEAIHKGEELARKNMIDVCRAGTTIPFGLKKEYCSTTVVLRPAREGAGITAGGPARSILALAGLTDCTAKFFGSNNRVNCARVTFEALKNIESPRETLKHRRDRDYRIESRREMRKPEAKEKEAGEAAKAPAESAPAGAPAAAAAKGKPADADDPGAKKPTGPSLKKSPRATKGDKPKEAAPPEKGEPDESGTDAGSKPDADSGEVQE
jgi:small subunit ribosomal protein S5